MESLGQLIVEISTEASKLNQGLKDAEAKVQATTQKINEYTGKIGLTLTAIGGVVTGAFAAMVGAAVEYGDEIYEVSQRTGIATETLSKLRYVAEQTESSFEAVSTGLRYLSKNIYEASTGSTKANEAFRELGISVTDNVTGKLLSAENAFLQIADKFKGLDDATAKSALAMEIFGRGGAALIPVLNLGSEGITRLSEQAEKLGVVLTAQNAKSIDQFSDDMKSMKASIGGLWLNLTTLLLPALDDFIKKITNVIVAVRQWSEAHPKLSKALTEGTLVLGVSALALGTFLLAVKGLIWQIEQLYIVFTAVIPVMKIFTVLRLGGLLTDVGILVANFGVLYPLILAIGAALLGWKLGRFISEVTGLDNALSGQNGLFTKMFMWLDKSKKGFEDLQKAIIAVGTLGMSTMFQSKKTVKPSVTTAPSVSESIVTPSPNKTELDTTLGLLEKHAQAIKSLNESYIAGKINAEQYLSSARTLYQDGIDLATQHKDILDQELNLERLLTDTEVQKSIIQQNNLSEAISLAQQVIELTNLETDAEAQKLSVMQQGISVVQQYYQVKAQFANQSIVDQQNELAAMTNFLQTVQSMHQTIWAGIWNGATTMLKTFSQAFSTAISGMILGTMTVGQAFKQLGITMITAIVNYVVEWAVQAALSLVLGWTIVKGSIAQAAVVATAWADAAALVSLATLGANAIPAGAGIIAVTGLAEGIAAASAVAALAEGGIVRNPTLALIGEAGPEAVVPLNKSGFGAGGFGTTINLGGIHIESPIIKNDIDIEDLAEKLGENIQTKLRRVS